MATQRVTLKRIELNGDDYVGQRVRVEDVELSQVSRARMDGTVYLQLMLQDSDGTMSFEVYADRARLGETVQTLPRQWGLSMEGTVVELESGNFALIVDTISLDEDQADDPNENQDDEDAFDEEGDEDDEEDEDGEDLSEDEEETGERLRDLSDQIERQPSFEQRAGVRLEGLSAFFEIGIGSPRLEVRGELQASTGTLGHDVEVVAAAYDSRSRVVGTGSFVASRESFFQFEVFEITVYCSSSDVVRVRVHPKKLVE